VERREIRGGRKRRWTSTSFILQTHRAVQVILLHSDVLADTSEDDVSGCSCLVCGIYLVALFVLVILQQLMEEINGKNLW
jgi:hypothetical protein